MPPCLKPSRRPSTPQPVSSLPSRPTRRGGKDFKRAGIPLVDDEGRHADLHSLRSTLATQLARSGVSPQLHQEFMRHSDYRTTREFYTHLRLEDLSKAARALEAAQAEATQESRESQAL